MSTTCNFGSTALLNAGDRDGFLTKLTDMGTSGTISWAKQLGGAGFDEAFNVVASGANVYVTGEFAGQVAFGSFSLASYGLDDGYVAKLTDAGTTASFVWVQAIQGGGSDGGTALALNGTSLYVAGYFSGSAQCGGYGGLGLNSSGNADVFVAKLVDAGSTGGFEWARSGGGPSDDKPHDIAVEGTNVYVAGQYEGGPPRFGLTTLPVGTWNSIFVAKLTDNGARTGFTWAWGAGGSNGQSDALALVARGPYVYAAGYFSGTITLGTTTLTGGMFLCKLVDAGSSYSFAWAQSTDAAGATALALFGNRLYVAGALPTTTAFGSLIVPNTGTTPLGFLASLTDPALTATTAAWGTLSFSLAPNPAHTATTVQLPAVPAAPAAILTLTDALGRLVHTETLPLPATGLRHALDLKGLAPGVYAVQVRAGAVTATQRLVVE
ncbi:T9SS type A sorting domain-containing protein [Hymenobacter sp. M29]|uniref:T9SS type A sorting domain-containing protein n=2 Tax=Hymenobacter mellowenesis TaxID=3063995 RepID=A0ABT9AGT4_9BACT|nr:T9SS type A sorting domain-containing protein [Hymenobacter sp. M29]